MFPIIGSASPQLTKAIIEDNWLNVIKLVTQKFSEKSHTYERILNEVIQRIPFDDLYKSVFNKKTKNLDMATKLFQFYKKNLLSQIINQPLRKLLENLILRILINLKENILKH